MGLPGQRAGEVGLDEKLLVYAVDIINTTVDVWSSKLRYRLEIRIATISVTARSIRVKVKTYQGVGKLQLGLRSGEMAAARSG